MKVEVLGGGPAGLYSAILIKKSFPHARIRVTERNRPDDTFGFGVVFSDQTLSGIIASDRSRLVDPHLSTTSRRTTGAFACGPVFLLMAAPRTGCSTRPHFTVTPRGRRRFGGGNFARFLSLKVGLPR